MTEGRLLVGGPGIEFWKMKRVYKDRRGKSQSRGLPRCLSGKESACQCRRHKFNLWVGKISWRKKWQPTPEFLPGKSHGQRSLAGYSPRGRKESDTTEHLSNSTWETKSWWWEQRLFPRRSSSTNSHQGQWFCWCTHRVVATAAVFKPNSVVQPSASFPVPKKILQATTIL